MTSKKALNVSLSDVFAIIEDGFHIVTAMAAAEPRLFFRNLSDHFQKWKNVKITCANPNERYPCYFDPNASAHIELRPLFLSAAVRKDQGQGYVHYIPQHLSQWSKHLMRDPIDIFWGTCSPPDSRGYVNLGLGACYETELLRCARIVVLEVNHNVPITCGATNVATSEVDYFVNAEYPMWECPDLAGDETDHQIAQYVADLIPNGATIQLGIGGLPNAIATSLEHHKDLGIHTELLNGAMMRLFERGVVTGAKKTLWPHKIIAAFVLGQRALYDFVHNNPAVELHPASVVNDPYRIGRNFRMHSINTAVEIDLTGQVCSESIGHRQLSGVGGAADTHVGATRSDGGRGIIALRSRQGENGPSKIVTALRSGAKVSISRNDVDTIVTEYGVAELKGRSVAERAHALISIAHPDFREQLEAEARGFSYV